MFSKAENGDPTSLGTGPLPRMYLASQPIVMASDSFNSGVNSGQLVDSWLSAQDQRPAISVRTSSRAAENVLDPYRRSLSPRSVRRPAGFVRLLPNSIHEQSAFTSASLWLTDRKITMGYARSTVLRFGRARRSGKITRPDKFPTPLRTRLPRLDGAAHCVPVRHRHEGNRRRTRTPKAVPASAATRSCSS